MRADDARLNDLGRQEDAKRLNIALTRIDEAQRMAGQLNQDANALAAGAAKTINDVLLKHHEGCVGRDERRSAEDRRRRKVKLIIATLW